MGDRSDRVVARVRGPLVHREGLRLEPRQGSEHVRTSGLKDIREGQYIH